MAGSAGIGLFFAFWSWVGFESAAMYGEESKDPTKIIPRATMLSVVGIGIFYLVVSWAALIGTGPQQAVALAQDTATAGNISFGPVEQYLGPVGVGVFEFLLMSGSYACGMAFHNCARATCTRSGGRTPPRSSAALSARRTRGTVRPTSPGSCRKRWPR